MPIPDHIPPRLRRADFAEVLRFMIEEGFSRGAYNLGDGKWQDHELRPTGLGPVAHNTLNRALTGERLQVGSINKIASFFLVELKNVPEDTTRYDDWFDLCLVSSGHKEAVQAGEPVDSIIDGQSRENSGRPIVANQSAQMGLKKLVISGLAIVLVPFLGLELRAAMLGEISQIGRVVERFQSAQNGPHWEGYEAIKHAPMMPRLERPTIYREVTILGGVGHQLVIFFEGFPEDGEERAPRISTDETFKDGYNGGWPVDRAWDLRGVRRICVYQKSNPNNIDCASGPFNPTGEHNSVATLKL